MTSQHSPPTAHSPHPASLLQTLNPAKGIADQLHAMVASYQEELGEEEVQIVRE